MRRPIQIASSNFRRTTGESLTVLNVLCDDGTIWESWESDDNGRKWVQIEGLPQDEATP